MISKFIPFHQDQTKGCCQHVQLVLALSFKQGNNSETLSYIHTPYHLEEVLWPLTPANFYLLPSRTNAAGVEQN